MKISLRLARIAIVVCLWSFQASANEVPAFSPNVVDLTQTLSESDRQEVNQAIAQARELADIWSAVLIVQKLENDTMETLSEKVFRDWKLGDAKKDNGLLLLLSIDDRQSRFEVGYGLEGDLPDVIAMRVLDNVLAPLMQENKVKEAIVQSINYMAGVRSKNPVYQEMIALNDELAKSSSEAEFRSNTAMSAFVIVYFLVPFFTRRKARKMAAGLVGKISSYDVKKDIYLYPRYYFSKRVFTSTAYFFGIGFAFVVFCGFGNVFLAVGLVGLGVYSFFHYAGHTQPYTSVESYREFAKAEAKRVKDMVRKGYMKKHTDGVYEYTDAYYASAEYAGSIFDDDSSSGGGSSGGGGATSSW